MEREAKRGARRALRVGWCVWLMLLGSSTMDAVAHIGCGVTGATTTPGQVQLTLVVDLPPATRRYRIDRVQVQSGDDSTDRSWCGWGGYRLVACSAGGAFAIIGGSLGFLHGSLT